MDDAYKKIKGFAPGIYELAGRQLLVGWSYLINGPVYIPIDEIDYIGVAELNTNNGGKKSYAISTTWIHRGTVENTWIVNNGKPFPSIDKAHLFLVAHYLKKVPTGN